jgi:hypothetical protein
VEIHKPCNDIVVKLTALLQEAQFRVERSFDLQSARIAGCTCPHHGTDQCDCQYIVLLVYDDTPAPLTLVVHGHDGWSWITLADTPQQPPSRDTVITLLSNGVSL